MAAANWHAYRSFSRDRSITQQRLNKGIVRRVASYARPYRWTLALFLACTCVSAVITVAVPLLLETIIDQGILKDDTAVVLEVAGLVAALAVVGALISVATRWLSARTGEGLIYDLRTQVFGHVQRQPIAFFTRAQTGSLVSRLNSDVIGAQQALTSTLSGVVSNALTLLLVLIAMLCAVLAGDGGRPGAAADVRDSRPAGRPPAAAATPGSRCSSTPRWAAP